MKKICSIEECNDPVTARGWCKKHYQRWRIHGDPLVNLRVKEFCKRGHPKTEGQSSCLLCRREAEKSRELNPEARKRRRDLRYQRLYGITYDEAESMAKAQDYKCFVCKDSCTFETKGRGAKGSFVLDHCHITGSVRGLLCHRCNKVLGLAHDDFELLHSLADYLVKPVDLL